MLTTTARKPGLLVITGAIPRSLLQTTVVPLSLYSEMLGQHPVLYSEVMAPILHRLNVLQEWVLLSEDTTYFLCEDNTILVLE